LGLEGRKVLSKKELKKLLTPASGEGKEGMEDQIKNHTFKVERLSNKEKKKKKKKQPLHAMSGEGSRKPSHGGSKQ